MKAEILAIGDELASGQRVDTNSAWISRQLADLGITTLYHTTVADDLAACAGAFHAAANRANIVIATGGLGPTQDDLTRQAMAMAFGRPLQLDRSSLASIRRLFESRGREMPPQNETQAMFPAGSRIIPNPHGTAPGIDIMVASFPQETRVFALPGVPAEMKSMWRATVAPTLHTIGAGVRMIVHRRLKCFGMGESAVEQRLPDLIRRGRRPSVGITVHRATITLRVTCDGIDERDCRDTIQPTLDLIRECLGDLVFGEEDDELHDVVIRELATKKLTLSTAEWGTAGRVARWLRGADPAERTFLGGVVGAGHARDVGDGLATTRSWGLPRSFQAQLESGELPRGDLHSALERIAEVTRVEFSTDFGLAIGPFAENVLEDPRSVMSIAIATANGAESITHPCNVHPDILVDRTAKLALNDLRARLRLTPHDSHQLTSG